MKDPIKNRFDEFIDRVENEEGDQATNEVIAYLKGFADNEENKTEEKVDDAK